MTLAQFALLVEASPKWVLNARAVLGGKVRYLLPVAQRVAIARALQAALGLPLPPAFKLAGEALQGYSGGKERVTVGDAGRGIVVTEVDVHRVLAAVNVRLSQLRTMHAPRQAGRPPKARRQALKVAEEYGVDLSLLAANLGRSPAERLRQLDGMVEFRRRVRRKASA